MVMMYPLLAFIVVVLGLVATVTALFPQREHHTTPLAHMQRFRALPAFQRAARRYVALAIAEVIFLLLAVTGAALLAGRVIETSTNREEKAHRDIVLCLDSSGSMAAVDRQIIDVYLELSKQLSGERIGLVVFDSSAVTVFPLTDDAAFIQDQLSHVRKSIGLDAFPGTTLGKGSSLIGDGLASCIARFDAPEQRRSRTIVFATDNQLAGDPIYTLQKATDRAVEREIMVFGVTPRDNRPAQTVALRNQTERTHGTVLQLNANGQTDINVIRKAVETQERVAMAARPRPVLRDKTWPGALLGVLGLLGALGCQLARRRG